MLSEVYDPDYYAKLSFMDTTSQRAHMRAERQGIWRDEWSTWLGKPLSYYASITAPEECRGHFDETAQVDPVDPAGWRAKGWAFPTKRSLDRTKVVFADEQGVIVGYGRAIVDRPDLTMAFGNIGSTRAGWVGHFKVRAGSKVQAHLLIAPRKACPFFTFSPP